jgi:hypothetical protein
MDATAADRGAFAEAVVFLSYFDDLPDPRQRGKVVYPLDEVLVLALLAVLAGAETFVDIARFGAKKLALLRRFRPFRDGTPSHDHLVGHSVRSSVLCGPVSCREVDHVATTNESVARLECGGADGVDAVEPVAAYAGGSGRAGGGVAGGCRRAELHSRRAEGRTPR